MRGGPIRRRAKPRTFLGQQEERGILTGNPHGRWYSNHLMDNGL